MIRKVYLQLCLKAKLTLNHNNPALYDTLNENIQTNDNIEHQFFHSSWTNLCNTRNVTGVTHNIYFIKKIYVQIYIRKQLEISNNDRSWSEQIQKQEKDQHIPLFHSALRVLHILPIFFSLRHQYKIYMNDIPVMSV